MATPLRYPGGKALFADFFTKVISANGLDRPRYVEPYCGGAGAAIKLLEAGTVSEIHLNDANFSIYSFWYCIKHLGDQFLAKFDSTTVSLSTWRAQREILKSSDNKVCDEQSILANGFATFFLNRCNRSGILNAGPIGGQSESSQKEADYKIDARYNRVTLRSQIEALIKMKDRIFVYNEDALDFLAHISKKFSPTEQANTIVYLDPPYYVQGGALYLNFYGHEDHEKIANYLRRKRTWKWVLSYDNVQAIKELYYDMPQYKFYVNYSAQFAKLGSEILLHSTNCKLPESLVIKQIKRTRKVIELVSID